MAQQFYLYEQQYQLPAAASPPGVAVPQQQRYWPQGWFDDAGLTLSGWFDQDIVNILIPLNQFEPEFFDDPDIFFSGPDGPKPLPGGRPTLPAQVQPHITVEVLPEFFDDPDIFYVPATIRALFAPDQMLKNEVRRI